MAAILEDEIDFLEADSNELEDDNLSKKSLSKLDETELINPDSDQEQNIKNPWITSTTVKS